MKKKKCRDTVIGQKKGSKNMTDFSETHKQVNMGGLVDTQRLRTHALKSDLSLNLSSATD